MRALCYSRSLSAFRGDVEEGSLETDPRAHANSGSVHSRHLLTRIGSIDHASRVSRSGRYSFFVIAGSALSSAVHHPSLGSRTYIPIKAGVIPAISPRGNISRSRLPQRLSSPHSSRLESSTSFDKGGRERDSERRVLRMDVFVARGSF